MTGDRLPDADFWRGRSVFLTGHTGFVGGWLALWLARMGAQVTGYSLAPPTEPSFCASVKLSSLVPGTSGDVRDRTALERALAVARPQLILHLAAQPLVGLAFREPYDTFTTNVLGTLNVLEAASSAPSIEAVIVFTTDKVYADSDAPRAFREDDPLGGKEPYALSKACAEFAVAAYRHSRHAREHPERGLVTVRAGNILGGGDWAAERLVPDAMRAFHARQPLILRKPQAVRPWQFVLDAVCGVLLLAETAVRAPRPFNGAWNFGPEQQARVTAAGIADILIRQWGLGATWSAAEQPGIPETLHLELDSAKAVAELGWQPQLSLDRALAVTVAWYRSFYAGEDMRKIAAQQIDDYCARSMAS